MDTLDCPFCDGPLTVDESLTQVACEACGVTAQVASDPVHPRLLEPAA